MCKIQEMSERKYIEHKNRIIKDLYKTIHKYNKKLTFYADKKLMMLLSDIKGGPQLLTRFWQRIYLCYCLR